MANYLKYSFAIKGASADSIANGEAADKPSLHVENPVTTVFTSVDNAKSSIDFTSWDFTGLTPEWTLENDNKRLSLKLPFTDTQANDGTMFAFHNKVLDGTYEASITINHNWLERGENNKYVINDYEI